MKALQWNPRYFIAFVLLTLVEVCIALFVHDAFVRPYLGDVLVAIVVYCFVRSFLPAYRWLPLGVFLFAALVEFAQYLDLAVRLGLGANRFLMILLGATFDWADILCYLCGCAALAAWQLLCKRRGGTANPTGPQ